MKIKEKVKPCTEIQRKNFDGTRNVVKIKGKMSARRVRKNIEKKI